MTCSSGLYTKSDGGLIPGGTRLQNAGLDHSRKATALSPSFSQLSPRQELPRPRPPCLTWEEFHSPGGDR
jgi:hypothetical protein